MSNQTVTRAQIAMAQTGRTVELGHGRTFEMLIKYNVWYAVLDTPFGVEYYGPITDSELVEAL